MAKASIKASPPYIVSIVKGVYKGEPKKVEGEIELIDLGKSKLEVEFKHRIIEGMDPTKADIVIGAGRGFKSRDDLKIVDELAKLLGGAWSVTRPLAADYGWCEHWIGISGLVINPKIYLIVGSSGQPHHMLGARGSKIIIAINKDRDAPVFEEADYGLVGDLYKILPRFVEKIKELRGNE
jgi:electron transfer flavoprotein alpha subunit